MCFIYSHVFCFKLNKPICDQYNHMTAVLGGCSSMIIVCCFCGGKKSGGSQKKVLRLLLPRTSDKLNLITVFTRR